MKNSCTSTDDEIEEYISQDTDSEFNTYRNYQISTCSAESRSNLPRYTSKNICNHDKLHNIDILCKSNKKTTIRSNAECNEVFKREKPSIQLLENSSSSTSRKRGSSTGRISSQRMKTKKDLRNSISFGKGTTNNGRSSNDINLKKFSKRPSTVALNSLSQIDRFSRILFPLSFFLLNIMYWFIYLKRSERMTLTYESF